MPVPYLVNENFGDPTQGRADDPCLVQRVVGDFSRAVVQKATNSRGVLLGVRTLAVRMRETQRGPQLFQCFGIGAALVGELGQVKTAPTGQKESFGRKGQRGAG